MSSVCINPAGAPLQGRKEAGPPALALPTGEWNTYFMFSFNFGESAHFLFLLAHLAAFPNLPSRGHRFFCDLDADKKQNNKRPFQASNPLVY